MFKFRQTQRLKCSEQFKKVFATRQKISYQNLSVFYNKNNNLQARLGISVSKKWVPLAVNRNRIKRVIRESFRRVNLPRDIDIVVVVHSKDGNLGNQQCANACDKLWEKLTNIYKKFS